MPKASKAITGARTSKDSILYIAVKELNPCAKDRAINDMVDDIKERIEGKNPAQTIEILKNILEGLKPETMFEVLSQYASFIGKLYGKDVILDDIDMQEINYIKRADKDREKLRKEFDSTERENFIKNLAEKHEKELKEAGITDEELLKMKDGLLPSKEWQVHHKLPLDDGGTNAENNLVLIKNHPYHKVITTHQNTIVAKQIEGKDECIVKFPIPPGNIYPPETREEFEKSIPVAKPKKKKKMKNK